MRLARRYARRVVSGLVASPTAISTGRRFVAGWKKWKLAKRSRETARPSLSAGSVAASSPIVSDDVFVRRSSGRVAQLSISRYVFALIFAFSGTDSTTTGFFASSATSVEARKYRATRSRRVCASASGSASACPWLTRSAASSRSRRSDADATASSETSRERTGIPAFTKDAAIDIPMRPAPATPTPSFSTRAKNASRESSCSALDASFIMLGVQARS